MTVETVRIDDTTSTVDITMERIELPIITDNPRNKIRIIGQSVAFCCIAMGNPPVTKYEWFKNGDIVEIAEADNEKIIIEGLAVEDAGSYRCRVSNGAGSIFSDQATLIVSDSSSNCDTAPRSHYIDLPSECQQPDDLFNVGKCSQKPCNGQKTNQTSCIDTEEYCCLPSAVEKRSIQCGDYAILVPSIISCACGLCKTESVTISGVVTSESGSALRFGSVFMNGEEMGFTNHRGDFSVSITAQVSRVAITIRDSIFHQHLDTTKVVVVKKNTNVFIPIKMRQRPSPLLVQSMEDNVILLTSEGLSKFAEIAIPSNSTFNNDGTMLSGQLKLFVNIVDMRSQSDVDYAEGDFTAIDESGERQIIRSYGMVGIEVTDMDEQALTVGGSVPVHIDLSEVPIGDKIADVKLLKLNRKTGTWEFESSIVKILNGKFTGMLDLSNCDIYTIAWIYDKSSTDFEEICIAKVIPYASKKRNPSQVSDDTRLIILTRDKSPNPSNPNLEFFYRYPAHPSDDLSFPEQIGECVTIACDMNNNQRYDNYITVSTGPAQLGSYMLPFRRDCTSTADPCEVQNGIPDSELQDINYMITDGVLNNAIVISPGIPSEQNPSTGPLYSFSELRKCQQADETSKHFQFYLPQNLICINSALIDSSDRHNFYPPWVSEPCMMKIDLQSTRYDSLRVTAISVATEAFETDTNVPLYNPPNYQYGVRQALVHKASPESDSFDVCMEYKCPGFVHEPSGTTIGSADTEIQIFIQNTLNDGTTLNCMVCSNGHAPFSGVESCPNSMSTKLTSVIPHRGTNEASGLYKGKWDSGGPPKITVHDPINCQGSTNGAVDALKIICP